MYSVKKNILELNWSKKGWKYKLYRKLKSKRLIFQKLIKKIIKSKTPLILFSNPIFIYTRKV